MTSILARTTNNKNDIITGWSKSNDLPALTRGIKNSNLINLQMFGGKLALNRQLFREKLMLRKNHQTNII